jgi:hypothetical protein
VRRHGSARPLRAGQLAARRATAACRAAAGPQPDGRDGGEAEKRLGEAATCGPRWGGSAAHGSAVVRGAAAT